MPEETPAFLCERVGVELEVLKMTDGLTDDNRQNVLYVSRGQLKKHTSTVINSSFNVRYISQQVMHSFERLLSADHPNESLVMIHLYFHILFKNR